jgi:hypothetical protein
MARARGGLAVALSFLISFALLTSPVWGTSPASFGVVVYSQGGTVAEVGGAVGSTVFVGDRLGTQPAGSLQVRAGAARLQLSGSSVAIWGVDAGWPAAALTRGTATFSTANSKAFALHAGPAVFRPRGDEPTVGSVTFLNPKELEVRCSRGALTIAVEDDVRVIPEGSAYHVVLDPNASIPPNATPGPAPASWDQRQPIKAGKSKFIWYAIGFVVLVTSFALSEAFESADRP